MKKRVRSKIRRVRYKDLPVITPETKYIARPFQEKMLEDGYKKYFINCLSKTSREIVAKTELEDKINVICNLIKTGKSKKEIKDLLLSLPGEILSFMQYFSLRVIEEDKDDMDVDVANEIIDLIQGTFLTPFKGTVTLTFGEVAESHVGMQKIGRMAERGFSLDDLERAAEYFMDKGCDAFIIHLNEFLPDMSTIEDKEEKKYLEQAINEEEFQAYVLVVRNGMKCIQDDNEGKHLLTEMLLFEWDTKLYNERRGKVQNKLARHNLNFDEIGQEADFQAGKGTTVSWDEVNLLNDLRFQLIDAFGESAVDLKCEGNKYYAVSKTGIGYHGDSERRKVIGVRLGHPMSMHWMWFYKDKPRGLNVSITLQPGDIYAMSEKTVGTDWRPKVSMGWKSKRYTLRHAAGADKYTIKTPKIHIRDQRPYEHDDNITLGDIYFRPKKSKTNPKPSFTKM